MSKDLMDICECGCVKASHSNRTGECQICRCDKYREKETRHDIERALRAKVAELEQERDKWKDRLESSKRLYEMTLANELRWMRKTEDLAEQMAGATEALRKIPLNYAEPARSGVVEALTALAPEAPKAPAEDPYENSEPPASRASVAVFNSIILAVRGDGYKWAEEDMPEGDGPAEAPKAEEPKPCEWCGGTRVLCFGGPQLECGHCAKGATNAE